MRSLLGWIEPLKQPTDAVELGTLLTAVLKDSTVLGVLPLYLLAFAWLAYRFIARPRSRRRSRQRYGPQLGEGLLRLLAAVAFLTLGLLLGVARSAGRSTFHSGARF